MKFPSQGARFNCYSEVDGGVHVTHESASPVAAHRMFKALFLERHVVFPKAEPQTFKSIEIIQGDGGVGTIQKVTFAEGMPFKYMLHRIDALDKDNYYFKYTLFEGDVLGDKMESVVYEVKFEPSGAGCKAKMTSHHHPKPGHAVNEEEVKAGKEKAHGLYKAVEGYLLSNPDVYA